MRASFPLLLLLPLAGCDALAEVGEALVELKAPLGDLSRVDLVQSPPAEDLALWGCFEVLGELDIICSAFGEKPRKNDLGLSFDLVFALENPNADLPIPLVDLLLGFTVFEDANLGAACLSFCDPEVEDCVPTAGAVETCEPADDEIEQVGDLIPSVEDLFALAEDLAADGSFDNGDWRVIPGGGSSEAHVQFDLQIDTLLGLADDLLIDAAEDLLAGRNLKVDVPYSADGTMFFEAPALGRKGLGFGPVASIWTIQ